VPCRRLRKTVGGGEGKGGREAAALLKLGFDFRRIM